MKKTLIELLTGFIGKTPKRLNAAKWIILTLVILASALVTLSNQGMIAMGGAFEDAMTWIVGIATAVGISIGMQFAKKDPNEK